MISGRWAGCGQSAWAARLTCHLVYLRLTTRGNDRARRLWVETPCEEGGGGLPEPGELPFRGKSRPVGRCHGRFGVQQRTRPGLGLGRR